MKFSTIALGLVIAVVVAPASYACREANCAVRTVVDDIPDAPFMYFMTTDEDRCIKLCRDAAGDEVLHVSNYPGDVAPASKRTVYQCILRSLFQEKVIGEYAFPDR